MIVDQHQPIVEKYYGSGKMTPVIERLLQESDRVVKDINKNDDYATQTRAILIKVRRC